MLASGEASGAHAEVALVRSLAQSRSSAGSAVQVKEAIVILWSGAACRYLTLCAPQPGRCYPSYKASAHLSQIGFIQSHVLYANQGYVPFCYWQVPTHTVTVLTLPGGRSDGVRVVKEVRPRLYSWGAE
jgi:hypothetical protein